MLEISNVTYFQSSSTLDPEALSPYQPRQNAGASQMLRLRLLSKVPAVEEEVERNSNCGSSCR